MAQRMGGLKEPAGSRTPGDTLRSLDLDRLRALMLSKARFIVKNVVDAEDVVQDALERAWRARHRFAPGADARPWLLRITMNAALDFVRQRRNCVALSDLILERQPGRVPEEAALARELFDSVTAAITRLSPEHRSTFMLHDIHGYSNHEIAAHQKLPYHTVRTHLFRARRTIRRALSGTEHVPLVPTQSRLSGARRR